MVGRLERVNIEEQGVCEGGIIRRERLYLSDAGIAPEEIRRSRDLVRPYLPEGNGAL